MHRIFIDNNKGGKSMAKIINVVMKRAAPSGLVCRSVRQIVVWGPAAKGDTVDLLSSALIDVEQTLAHEGLVKSHSDVVREVCNKIFPGNWDFAAQGGTVEY